jgi:opacity protein-like surface antigen
MKIYQFLALFLFMSVGQVSLAQRFEISPMGGFNFGGKLPTTRGDLRVRNNGEWGLIASYRLNKIANIELSYTGVSTTIEHDIRNSPDVSYGDWMVNYFLLGSTKELYSTSKLRPFGNFSLGAVWFDPSNNFYDDEVRFAFSAGIGVKYFFSDKIGVRLQTRLLSPLYGAGVGVSCGNGCGASVGSTSLFLSGDVSGGLIIAIE